MAQKTVGYVKLQWTCPNCGARNPGPQKSCSGCGAAQPANVEFEQAAQEELVRDEAEIQRAKSGPDVHCAYCGARNPAGAEVCTQCGANLAEAAARAAGKVLGAHRAEPVPDVICPSCGAPNPATALKCTKCGASLAQPAAPVTQPAATGRGCRPIAIVGGVVALGIIAALIFLVTKTSDVVGTVRDVSWMRSVAIEALGPATYQTWRDQVPRDARPGRCVEKVRGTSSQQTANSREVCGTPYTKDTGSGYGEVVQDCVYEVYDDWCDYTVMEWQQVDALVLEGADLNPRWPEPQLATDRRAGERAEKYEITFDADGKQYVYTTRDSELFGRCEVGSRWILKVNQLGSVAAIEPVA
jgi:ribosomal protein L40E